MQGVTLFSAAEPRLIRDCLDHLAQATGRDSWVLEERMWILMEKPPNWLDGIEDVRAEVELKLGSDVTVVNADVGSKNRIEDVRSFALAILSLGPGLAFDDYTSRGWTIEGLTTDESIDGRKFFSGDGTVVTPPRKPKFWRRRK